MSVQNLRKTYIDKGKLSVCHDTHGRPYVELVECLRVFPERFSMPDQREESAEGPVVGNPVASSLLELQQQRDALESENRLLRERLQVEQERRAKSEANEEWFREHVEKLTEENLKLLSAPPAKKQGWLGWFGA